MTSSHARENPAGPEETTADVGVLVVHGIGWQTQSETVDTYVDAIYGWLRDRLAGVVESHRMRGISRETLERATGFTAEALRNATSEAWTGSETAQWIAFLDNSSSFRPAAELATDGRASLPLTPGSPLFGSVTLSAANASTDNAPKNASLHLKWVTTDGVRSAVQWRVAEAWWADAFPTPRFDQLVRWAPIAVPIALLNHAWSMPTTFRRRTRLHDLFGEVLYAVRLGFLVLASIFAALPIYLILLLAEILARVPWSPLQALAQAVRNRLTGSIGDALALVESPSCRNELASRVQRDLLWLSERCKSVLVIAHSQGAMLAYLACRRRPENVATLVTLGSGIRQLRTLIAAAEAPGPRLALSRNLIGIAQALGLACILAGVAGSDSRISFGVSVGLASTCGLLALSVGLVGISSFYTLAGAVPADDDFWRARMTEERFRWRDLIATHDPVAGPLDTHLEIVTVDQLDLRSRLSARGRDFGIVPHTRLITNWQSTLHDHTSYLVNRDECVSTLVFECARLDGSGSHEWLAPDPERIGIEPKDNGFAAPISDARRRIVQRWKWLSMGLNLIVLAMVWSRFYQTFAITRPWNGDSWTAIFRDLLSIVSPVDLALAIVLVSIWRALSTARTHALGRLTAAVLESRNYRIRVTAGVPSVVDNDFHEFGKLWRAEWLILASSGGVPLLLFVLLLRVTVNQWTLVIATLMAAAIGHLLSEFLRADQLRREREAPYKDWLRTASSVASTQSGVDSRDPIGP